MSDFYAFNQDAFNRFRQDIAADERAKSTHPIIVDYAHTNSQRHSNNHTNTSTSAQLKHTNIAQHNTGTYAPQQDIPGSNIPITTHNNSGYLPYPNSSPTYRPSPWADGIGPRSAASRGTMLTTSLVPGAALLTSRGMRYADYTTSSGDSMAYDVGYNDNPPHTQSYYNHHDYDNYSQHSNIPHQNVSQYIAPTHNNSGHNNSWLDNYEVVAHANFAPTLPQLYSQTLARCKDTIRIGFYSWDESAEVAVVNPQAASSLVEYRLQIRKVTDRWGNPSVSNWVVAQNWGRNETLDLNTLDLLHTGNTNIDSSEGGYQLLIQSRNIVNGKQFYSPTGYFSIEVDNNNNLEHQSLNAADYVNFIFGPNSIKTTSGAIKQYADATTSLVVGVRAKDLDGGTMTGSINPFAANGPVQPEQKVVWQNGQNSIQPGSSEVTGYAAIPFSSLKQLREQSTTDKIGLRVQLWTTANGNDSYVTKATTFQLPLQTTDLGFVQVDIAAPTISLTQDNPATWTDQKQVHVVTIDSLAGLDRVKCTFEETVIKDAPRLNGVRSYNPTLDITCNGTLKVESWDVVGNYSVTTLVLDHIDSQVPGDVVLQTSKVVGENVVIQMAPGEDPGDSSGVRIMGIKNNDPPQEIPTTLTVNPGDSYRVWTQDNVGHKSQNQLYLSNTIPSAAVAHGVLKPLLEANYTAQGLLVNRSEGIKSEVLVATASKASVGSTSKLSQTNVDLSGELAVHADTRLVSLTFLTPEDTTLKKIADFGETSILANSTTISISQAGKQIATFDHNANGQILDLMLQLPCNKPGSIAINGNWRMDQIPTSAVDLNYKIYTSTNFISDVRIADLAVGNKNEVSILLNSISESAITESATLANVGGMIPITHFGAYQVDVRSQNGATRRYTLQLPSSVPSAPAVTQQFENIK